MTKTLIIMVARMAKMDTAVKVMITNYQGQTNLLLIVTVKDYNVNDAIIDANNYEDNYVDARDIRLS